MEEVFARQFAFKIYWPLATHLKTHQSSYGVLVQEVMPDPQLSKSRKKLSMSLKCPKFDYKTSQKIDLVKHIKDHYDCDHCDKGFYGGSGKRQLARHLKAHQSELTNCTVCDFCNNSKSSNLKRHKKNMSKEGGSITCNGNLLIFFIECYYSLIFF